jgi:hypothetical protein
VQYDLFLTINKPCIAIGAAIKANSAINKPCLAIGAAIKANSAMNFISTVWN